MRPASKLVKKFFGLRCLVCSIWLLFLSWSLIVSMRFRFRSISLSQSGSSLFFIFLLIPVTICVPCFQRVSNSSLDIYPLSPYSLPLTLWQLCSKFRIVVSNITWGKHERGDLTSFINNQMQLEPIEPTHTTHPPGSQPTEDFMSAYPSVMAYH